jgi:hypothetical protein
MSYRIEQFSGFVWQRLLNSHFIQSIGQTVSRYSSGFRDTV